jgi:SCY1-like protein 1
VESTNVPQPAPTGSTSRSLLSAAATPERVSTVSSPPRQSRIPVTAQAPQPSLVGLSKEDKAAEMARRKEERKQVRIQAISPSAMLNCW